MGFIAATIVAPNVPDKLDPLKYLVSSPQSKLQERAQAQAQALAYAALRGMSDQELERLVLGSAGPRKAYVQEMSREEQEDLQNKKTSTVPLQIERPADATAGSYVDYPYLFINSKIRPAFGVFNIKVGSDKNYEERSKSAYGKIKAPVIDLDAEVFNNAGAELITQYLSQFDECGIVKFRLKKKSFTNVYLPFNPETTGFRVQTEVLTGPETDFDYRSIKRGFFRALIRFHSSYNGSLMSTDVSSDEHTPTKQKRLNRMPTLERRAIDLFRMFLVVELKGGFDEVVKRKEWAQVGRELGYSSNSLPTLSTTMRQVYQKVVQPFRNWLAVHIDIDLRRIPILEVFDTVQRGQSMREWKKLSYGIYVKTVAKPTNFENRRVLKVADQQTASFTLRSYKARLDQFALHTEKESADNLENRFLALPEFWRTEQIFPGIYVHNFPAYFPANLDKTTMITDFSSLSLRKEATTWPSLIDDDLDSLLVARLSSGSQFSAEGWHKPNAGTYLMQILIEGNDKTWYSENGGWVDQSCGEIVIVAPHCKFYNWRHGYSSSVSMNFLLPSNWLLNALNSDDATCVVNLQKLVADVARSDLPVLEVVKTQVLQVLKMFKSLEIEYFSKLKEFLTTTRGNSRSYFKIQKPVICEGDKKRFFSYVVVDGRHITCEDFLSHFPSVKTAQFITCYEADPETYFDQLISALEAKTCLPRKEDSPWLKKVIQVLSGEKIPYATDLQRLLRTKPARPNLRELTAETNLINVLANFDMQSAQGADMQGDNLDFIVEAIASPDEEAFSVLNLKAKIQQKWQKLEDTATTNKEALGICNELLMTPEKLVPDSQKKYLRTIQSVLVWKTTVEDRFPTDNCDLDIVTLQLVQNLLEKGRELGIREMSILYSRLLRIKKNFEVAADAAELQNIEHILLGPQALDLMTVLTLKSNYVDGGKDPDRLPPSFRSQILALATNTVLISRVGHVDILQRPKRQEMAPLIEIWATKKLLEQLDAWLSLARTPNWEAIYRQLKAMVAREPPPEPLARISQSELYSIYSNFILLAVVPDDVLQVKSTFENTIQHFQIQPVQVLEQYGFIP